MKKILSCLVLALSSLACGYVDVSTGKCAGSAGSGGTDSGGAGGGGMADAGGSAGAAGGAPVGSLWDACLEDGLLTVPGSNSPIPAKCGCAQEAIQVLPALAAAAKASFLATGSLCGGTFPVPSSVPHDVYYMPGAAEGMDFHTGDATLGWKCLGVAMPQVIHCQYSYTKGASPRTAAAGGPHEVSAPESFEVAAEGDSDGDAATGILAITGQLDASGDFTLYPMLVVDPEE
jgi:hypothetical protein